MSRRVATGLATGLATLLALGLAACGGSSEERASPQVAEPTVAHVRAQVPTAPPLEVAVDGAYVESTFRVDVVADGAGRPAGDAFEDPRLWWISARVAGKPLGKLLISPAHVAREETDVPRVWNVRVAFSLYVEAPPVGAVVEVEVRPPHVPEIERFEVRPDPPRPPDPNAVAPGAPGVPGLAAAAAAAAADPDADPPEAKPEPKKSTKAKAKKKSKKKKTRS